MSGISVSVCLSWLLMLHVGISGGVSVDLCLLNSACCAAPPAGGQPGPTPTPPPARRGPLSRRRRPRRPWSRPRRQPRPRRRRPPRPRRGPRRPAVARPADSGPANLAVHGYPGPRPAAGTCPADVRPAHVGPADVRPDRRPGPGPAARTGPDGRPTLGTALGLYFAVQSDGHTHLDPALGAGPDTDENSRGDAAIGPRTGPATNGDADRPWPGWHHVRSGNSRTVRRVARRGGPRYSGWLPACSAPPSGGTARACALPCSGQLVPAQGEQDDPGDQRRRPPGRDPHPLRRRRRHQVQAPQVSPREGAVGGLLEGTPRAPSSRGRRSASAPKRPARPSRQVAARLAACPAGLAGPHARRGSPGRLPLPAGPGIPPRAGRAAGTR